LNLYVSDITIWIIASMLWRRTDVSSRLNHLRISILSESNFNDWSATSNCTIRRHFLKILRIRCHTSCKKLLLLSRTKSSIYMSSLKCVDTLIRRWEIWTISSEISEKISIMMIMQMTSNVKESLSLLTRIKSIKTLTDRFLVLDLKSSNRVLVRLLNHHLKIKWILSIATIVKNLIITHAIVVNSKRWISTNSYVKWTCTTRMIHQVKISTNRKKINLCYSRSRDRWDENDENRSVQIRE
jgi:hypothetical protein